MLEQIKPITERKIRIALVGCGRIAQKHIFSIASHSSRAQLVAICDTNSERIAKAHGLILEANKEYSNTHFERPFEYTSYSQLLDDIAKNKCQIDLVVITTPSGLHPKQVIAAAKVGLHVCTEKPMATRWDDGRAMVQACDDAGVYLFVVKQNRFNTTLQLLKRQIDRGRFGRISIVSANVFWQRPQSYYDQDTWRGTWEFDGGALMNQASHYVDLIEWLSGPVESVSASIATIGRNIEVEDTAVLQLRSRSGALGTMSVTMLTFPKNLEGSITILGETGSVKIGGQAVNKIENWEFADESPDDKLVEEASYSTSSVYGLGHPKYYENVLDSLSGKSVPLCDGREGLKSLELLIGAYRSARDGKTVHLPLEY
jgi:UDP-N-acetyl-2-amino-2-deoxyglucuronate dehydrogenase